jgi:hypothetical protein
VSISREAEPKACVQFFLASAGIPVWRDTGNLWPGEDWRQKIREAITVGSFAFIACFSSARTASEVSYQNDELLLAVDQSRLRNPNQA